MTEQELSIEGVLGIDIGDDTTILSAIDIKMVKPDILRNDLAHQKTPTCVCFHDNQRSFGATAKQLRSSHKDTTFDSLLSMIVKENHIFAVQDNKFCIEQLLAMFLAKVRTFCTFQNSAYAIVIPETFDNNDVSKVFSAARIAGFDVNHLSLIYRTTAAAVCNASKKATDVLNGKKILYIDIGETFASAAIYAHDDKGVSHISSAAKADCSSGHIDKVMLEELKKQVKERYPNGNITKRGEFRLKVSCRKLKETLSGVVEAQATCENLIEGADVPLTFSRDTLESVCEPIYLSIKEMVAEAAKDVDKIDACELIGGGMRIPFVKRAIEEAITEAGIMEKVLLSYTLDSMASNAIGAAYSQVKKYEPQGAIRRPIYETIGFSKDSYGIFAFDSETKYSLSEDELKSAIETQSALEAKDKAVQEMSEARNKLESYIFEMKSLANGSREFTELIEKKECQKIVNAADQWLYDVDEHEATIETYTTKLENLKKEIEPSCKAYYARVEEERAKKEKELEELSKQAAEELEKSGGKEDHDFRKLSKPDRMKKVMMNKDEGTSLFKDGNIEPASLRYKRALQHCDKFFDLSEDDKKEVEEIKNRLHLNLSMCHIKMDNHDRALESLNVVLESDDKSTKALYRRAMVYEKKKHFSKAKNDLLKAQEIDGEDKSIVRLMQRVEIQIKRQKAKQKKMAQKMFG